MQEPTVPFPFDHANGIKFWEWYIKDAEFKARRGLRTYRGAKPRAFELRAGAYANGRGALVAFADGEADFKITVNLVSLELPSPHHFHVKLEEVQEYRSMLLNLGLFRLDDRLQTISHGYSHQYAETWVFERCYEHAPGGFAIACVKCQSRLRNMFEEHKEVLLATDSFDRLKGFES